MKKSATQKRSTGTGRQLCRFLLVVLACCLTWSMSALAQEKTIRGRITTEGGTPVAGASVTVKGSSTGTMTDANGDFSISAAKGAVLVVSSVGYTARELIVGDDTQVNAMLLPTATDISEVVVVGYGTQKKRNLTGSVASVNLESQRDAPNTNIGQYLQGSVPGLNVGISTFAGGTPPISIRGQVTLSGTQNVLIILDGVQYTGSLSSINPDDIATIDVLKDQSSTAVYGAQAANGVILITSRKGRYNQSKPRISVSSSFTHQQPTIGNMRPMNRDELLNELRQGWYHLAYFGPDFTTPRPSFSLDSVADASWKDPATQTILTEDFDWFDAATNNGSIVENSLSISGGSERFNYLLSGALVDQKGFIINDKFKRKTLRANLETKALEWWKIGLISSISLVNQDGAEPNFGSINRMPAVVNPYNADGSLKPFPLNTLEPSPLATYLVDDFERHTYLFGNIYTEIDFPFIKGLNYRMNFGNNYRLDKLYRASEFDGGGQGRAFKETQNYYDYTFDNILTYNRTFGDHGITATLLYGAVERKYERSFAEGIGFTRLTLGYNNLALASQQRIQSSAYEEALNYQMGRLNYSFKDKYLLTATLRRDGFSGFAKNNKYGTFPVLALGWIISDEKWLEKFTVIDFLKLRAGFGATGNQTQRYASLSNVTTNAAYVFGDGAGTAFGQFVETLGNDDLKWERTQGINVGIDFTMLNNRLTGTFDYYKNQTRDLLYRVAIPQATGFNDINSNLGRIDNTGFEAQITYRIIENKNFRWSTTINFATNKNEIKTLTGVDGDGDGKEDDLVTSGLFIGKSIGTVYDYQLDGIYQIGDPLMPGFFEGSYRVVDQNKDNDITSVFDRVFLGRREPAYRWSLFNRFEYKGFTLTFFLNAVQGGKNGYLGANPLLYYREDNSIRINYLRSMDFWSPTNPDGRYPRIVRGQHSRVEPPRWDDRSFIRIQDVSLSYNLASSLLSKMKVQSVNLYVSGKNLHTFTDWDGWDPEALNTDNPPLPVGQVHNGRPVLRAFTIGLNIVY
jgi:TonB-dependent starch-binding outer membrane protein SusC